MAATTDQHSQPDTNNDPKIYYGGIDRCICNKKGKNFAFYDYYYNLGYSLCDDPDCKKKPTHFGTIF